ncbi:MAG: hypothetical protein ACHQRM_01900 [Bacteroidia bacterium]
MPASDCVPPLKFILRISMVFILLLFSLSSGQAQLISVPPKDTSCAIPEQGNAAVDIAGQVDIIDIYKRIFRKSKMKKDSLDKARRDSICKIDTITPVKGKIHTSFLPGAGYTLQTRFAVALASNAAFYTDNSPMANLSVLNMYFAYTQNHQVILPLQSNIWTKGNKLNLLGDWRYYQYPQQTFGLGGHTSSSDADDMDYLYFTFHQIVAKHLKEAFYIGIGYNMDLHWGITDKGYADGHLTDYMKYTLLTGYSRTTTFASGPSLNLLYDNRRNSIYPLRGIYANLVFRQNTTLLGSDQNWESVMLDVRKYFKVPGYKNSVLALWGYSWITMGGNPAYLDLPSTAWDTYSNIGRGYIQSRYRGPGLLYLEAEYRFVLTENGLLGGVVFANAQSVSEWPGLKFDVVAPGAGLGIRIKVNKHSNTNFALDYGFGANGSNGIFVNLGEVF